MKILYVGGLDSAQKGAVGTHTAGVLNAFQALNVDVHAIFLDDQVPDAVGCKVTLARSSKFGWYFKKVFDRLSIARAAKREAEGHDYVYTRYDPFITPLIGSDNIVLEYNDDFLTQINFAASYGQFSRLGREVRLGRAYQTLIQRIESYCFQKARLVVCVTSRLCATVSSRQNNSRTFCMLNGSDAAFQNRLDEHRSEEVLTIGHIGTLTYWDGLRELLLAVAEFRAHHPEKLVKLKIIGDGSMKKELMTLTEQLKLNDVVELQSSVDRTGAIEALHLIDVVPLLKTISSYDLSPIKFYEALCTGRFLLCSNIPHINELDSDQGIIVSYPLDISEIARAINRLHDRLPEIRAGFASRSMKAVREHSWQSRIESLLEALHLDLSIPKANRPLPRVQLLDNNRDH